ncbi:MAG: DNA-binding response regulator [Clostridiales bacterium]|nr:DNA-binding response regulator [Clostridiales bacterium]
MYHIAICDDDSVYQEVIKELAESFFREKKQLSQVNYIVCSTLQELRECKEHIDLLLLDIELESENGIEFRKELVEAGEELPVVFVSGYENYIGEAFGKNVYGFIHKPIQKDDFERVMERMCQECLFMKQYQMNDGTHIREKDIYSIHAYADYSRLITVAGEYMSDMTISKWEEILPTIFFARVHRSCIVNMQNIQYLDKNVLMKNGMNIPISRRRLKDVKVTYHDYLRRRADYFTI